jgi:hypothetical protein
LSHRRRREGEGIEIEELIRVARDKINNEKWEEKPDA